MPHAADDLEDRILLLTPTPKDASLTQSMLEHAGIKCFICQDLEQICQQLALGAAALLIAEEALQRSRPDCLTDWLKRQPPWSDLPVLLLARPGANSGVVAQALEQLGNVTVLERPTRVSALVSAVRAARRARQRQYQLRDQLIEREYHLQEQAYLASIVSSSDDAIISKTFDGIVQTWNAGAERIFGYTADEMIGQSITLLIPPERQDEEPKLLERLRRGESIDHFETVRVTKGGRRIDISLTVSPVRDANGRLIGASKIARDITQRKQAEAALREADRRKDEFLATLAHELRNPLAPIRNSLHILRLKAANDTAADSVCEMMERQVNHMVRLVDDLMEVSRITRGSIELRREPIDLAAVIRSAVETSRPLIEGAGHQLAISLPREAISLYGDEVRLAQVFANLLNNAAKYTDRGGQIWITARRDGSDVAVTVRDNGIGLEANVLPVVFDMFMQADRKHERSQGGLGIGLTLVKSLVEMHGGSVSVQSAGPNQGSEFTVRLPIAKHAPREVTAPTTPQSVTQSRRRVLVVDDNADSAASLGMLLKILSMDVKLANDGWTALATIESFRPDVVLLDLGMPGMDGFEVARRVRERSEFDGIVLIALTGWGQPDDRDRTQAAGFQHHLVKPADIAALRLLLGSVGK